ncbi:MAG TPA: TetR/AcrR family transcriptional regulator [Caulobacteraceae bacterium]|nr:TetR/AcrR family transcriptional regulator [Caulobacteraceae bacterium]
MDTALIKPAKSARKAKGDGHLRRIEILEAAERIFVAEGYEGATIRKIADEVGVSSTALYMHFRDKDEILHEICLGAVQILLDQNSEIAARPCDPVTRVQLMLEAYVRMGLEHPNAYRLVFITSPRGTAAGPIREATAEAATRCYACYSGVVGEIAAAGRLRIGDTHSAAQALWAACHGLVALMITRPNVEWAPARELTSLTVEGLLHGLVAP